LLYGNELLIDKGFPQYYLERLPVLPKKDEVASRFMGEAYFGIRFLLFQNFYSQTEFTIKVIQRLKYPDEWKRNPYKLAAEKLGFLTSDMAIFLSDIRNTIHNNGFYFPHDRADKEYHYFDKVFPFKCGEAIYSVTMDDIFLILDYVLTESIKMFANDELASIKPLATR
jgi:hypothetical protein